MNQGMLVIRADASPAIGTGHVMRCLALAQGWRAARGRVTFAMAESTPAIERRLVEGQCRLVRIMGAPGCSEDCHIMCALIATGKPSWIAIDGYAFDSKYRQAVQDAGVRCLVVDDNGGDEDFSPDLVLNQNLHAKESMYPQRGAHTRLLLGPRYALLREEFARYRDWSRRISEKAGRILITMGGSDPSNSTPRVLEALSKLSELEVRVAIGGSAEHLAEVEEAAALFKSRVTLLRDVRNMAEQMAWADLAIAGAGTTCWEMCLLGLPTMLIVVAENQKPIADGLASSGAAVNLGWPAKIDFRTLADKVEELVISPDQRCAMSQKARELVDGYGKERVLDAMGVGESVCA